MINVFNKSKNWNEFFKSGMVNTLYFQKLLKFIVGQYKSKHIIPYARTAIFDAFNQTDYKELEVVILGDEPYHDYNSTGIAFANKEEVGGKVSPALTLILECIERNEKDGLYFGDLEFKNWTDQNILLLNSALTTELHKTGSHYKYWNRFIKYILEKLSEEKPGIVYCLWGERANSFKEHINSRINYILEYDSPQECVLKGVDWNCPHFKEVNNILFKKYGKQGVIKW